MSWLSMLGLEEMKQVLDREGLCMQLEAFLLELVIILAKDRVEGQKEYSVWLQLLQSVRFTLLYKKFV